MTEAVKGRGRVARRALTRVRDAYRRRSRTRVKIVYEVDLRTGRPDAGVTPFRLEPGTPDLVEALRTAYPGEVDERKRDILLARLEDPGEDCWVIVDDQGQVCGYAGVAWTDHLMRLQNHVIKVADHQMLLIDTYVAKAHRRRGAHTVAVLGRLRAGADRGRSSCLVVIDIRNKAARAVYAQLGARPVGRIITWMHYRRSVQLRRMSPEQLPWRRRRAR